MSTADCVKNYVAYVMERGGKRRIGKLEYLSTVRWSRRLSKVSTATLEIVSEHCAPQISTLDRIVAGRHELAIFRGTEKVWEGPIEEVAWTSTRVRITANDVFHYLNRTSLTYDWIYDQGQYATTNMLERIRIMIERELSSLRVIRNGTENVSGGEYAILARWEAINDPINILPYLDVRPGNVVTRSRTLAFEMMLGEHIQNLARSTVCYTALGRRLVFWDSRKALSRTRRVSDEDFDGDLEVISTAKNLSVWSHATEGQEREDSRGNPFIPRRSHWSSDVKPSGTSKADYYGCWERIVSEEGEDGEVGDPEEVDWEALRERARADAQGRWPTPLEIRTNEAGIILSNDLSISQLVPGVILPVSATWNLKPVQQDMLLSGISVEDEGNGERVQPTLVAGGPVEVIT